MNQTTDAIEQERASASIQTHKDRKQNHKEKYPNNAKPSGAERFTRQAFGLTVLTNSHPDIKRLRRATGNPTIHGNKFWKSTYILMDYLNAFPLKKNLRVLEVGCGWGLGAIYCAKRFNSVVTGLDADPVVFPYCEHHAALNGVEVEVWRSRYENVRKQDLAAFDVVIGTDICFWDSMVDPLYNLIRRAYQVGSVRVIMADPGRPTFRDVANKAVEKLGAEYVNRVVPQPHSASGVLLDMKPSAI